MNINKNARLTPLRREEMALSVIEGGLSKPLRRPSFGIKHLETDIAEKAGVAKALW
ncbi:hypothetical protein NKJ10_25530 [Mesorhizobium sp. M0204]|uniref:hypothetical protein n=1 Tax=Mesorhizobium sp. M0204 TaxID=2956913 RepID=UPI003336E5F4